jgi:hypothetical protein
MLTPSHSALFQRDGTGGLKMAGYSTSIHTPNREKSDVSGFHPKRKTNIFGRISWVHRNSGLRSYRFPGTCKDFKYTANGDLYVEQNGVRYRSDWGFSRLQLNDLGVACQITHEGWNNGLSNEAAAVRGDLWWGSERVKQRHLKLSKNIRSRPLIAETNTAPEAAEPIDIEMDSDGTNLTARDDEMQSGGPPQRLEEDDGSEDGAKVSKYILHQLPAKTDTDLFLRNRCLMTWIRPLDHLVPMPIRKLIIQRIMETCPRTTERQQSRMFPKNMLLLQKVTIIGMIFSLRMN